MGILNFNHRVNEGQWEMESFLACLQMSGTECHTKKLFHNGNGNNYGKIMNVHTDTYPLVTFHRKRYTLQNVLR